MEKLIRRIKNWKAYEFLDHSEDSDLITAMAEYLIENLVQGLEFSDLQEALNEAQKKLEPESDSLELPY